MRHLLTVFLILFIGVGCWLAFADRGPQPPLHDALAADAPDSAEASPAQTRDYGDTLCQYDGKTVVFDCQDDYDEVSSLSVGRLVTYADTLPVHCCRVIGNCRHVADGPILKFVIGIDTVRYDMRCLPDSVDPTMELLARDVTRHRHSRVFSLCDSSFDCGFTLCAYLPPAHPAWLSRLMALILESDVNDMYSYGEPQDNVLKRYCDEDVNPSKEAGVNAADMTPERMAQHFAREFERLYRREFDGDAGEYVLGPKYDYMMELAPAWSSRDGRYVTYRFYTYDYEAGAHGYMQEYFLTFDSRSGRILGYEDIFGAGNFPKAIRLLEGKLTAHRAETYGMTDICPASLDVFGLESNESNLIKEAFCGAHYPRPALTDRGIVFSYQPYEQGAFCEGVLHFVIDYSELGVSCLRPEFGGCFAWRLLTMDWTNPKTPRSPRFAFRLPLMNR